MVASRPQQIHHPLHEVHSNLPTGRPNWIPANGRKKVTAGFNAHGMTNPVPASGYACAAKGTGWPSGSLPSAKYRDFLKIPAVTGFGKARRNAGRRQPAGGVAGARRPLAAAYGLLGEDVPPHGPAHDQAGWVVGGAGSGSCAVSEVRPPPSASAGSSTGDSGASAAASCSSWWPSGPWGRPTSSM